MPWTSSSLFTVSFVDQIIGEPNYIVGGRNGNMESISQPRWNGDSIIYLSDRSGYYQLYSHSKGGEESQVLKALTASDIGGPDWTFGQSTHQKLSPTTWISKAKGGNLAITTLATQESIIIETPFDSIQDIVVVSANKLALGK